MRFRVARNVGRLAGTGVGQDTGKAAERGGGRGIGRNSAVSGALAAAVLSGLLGSAAAPSAFATPADPSVGAPDTDAERPEDGHAARAEVPAVWPRPQSVQPAGGPSVALRGRAALVAAPDTDPYTLHALRALLRDAGVSAAEVRPGARLPAEGPVILVGGEQAEQALRALRAPARGNDLPSGGYRLAIGRTAATGGRDTVALEGVGPDGLFHAVQTLRQLVAASPAAAEGGRGGGRRLAPVAVLDWPGTAVRGTTEGFFGEPWSRQQRLEHLDFMGRTKQNRYLYAPGDDPYRQYRWRDPYPAAQRADFRALAERARANHVTLAWAIAPGQAMCMSSQDDIKALLRKVDAMWALGVRAFQLQFQDVSYSEWHCGADEDAFGSGPESAAKAQAKVAGALAGHLAERYPEAAPLSLMPTEYYQDGATAYRTALSAALPRNVEVAWTGVGVVPRTITGGELSKAREVFGHPMVTMDNYPVNDYAQDRIFLGPYTGREPAVATGSAALLSNAMAQPTASRIPLFTAADYAWNPRGYRPAESWRAAIEDLSGGDARARDALHALAGNDSSSVLDAKESGYLTPLIETFWKARATAVNSGDPGDDRRYTAAAQRLRAAFATMAKAPGHLTGDLSGLGGEVRPWAEQLARYGTAGGHAVDMLLAQARDDGAAAWRAQREIERLRKEIKKSPVTVGKGVLSPFLERAMTESDAWTGARAKDAPQPTEGAHPTTLTVPFERARPLGAVTALTEPGPGSSEVLLEARVPGRGWQRLGRLSDTGWTQAEARGLRADAVRLSWPEDAPAPSVHTFTPWFEDTPPAGLELSRKEADAEIGGSTAVDARIFSRRPADVRQKLQVKAPKGFTVKAPGDLTAPRGGTASARIEITVPADARSGTYEIPVSYGDQERVLTVRAYPRTGGPDLARGAATTSSGDETDRFPASAATDGDPKTRWSSPAEDGAWLQFDLGRPTRLGRLQLTWQDAHAAAYRIQVSPDGRTWRTAATVKDGKGGREDIRMDAKDARYVRIQGEKRATRFGYSLWSVQAYAVESEKEKEGETGKDREADAARESGRSSHSEDSAPPRSSALGDGGHPPKTSPSGE